MKKLKKIACAALALGLAAGISTTAYAASLSATLNTKKTQVTSTFNSGTSGYHVVRVHGYEYHPTLNEYIKYTMNSNVSGGGNLTTLHVTHNGYKFETYHAGVYLTSALYFGGSQIAKVNVTY